MIKFVVEIDCAQMSASLGTMQQQMSLMLVELAHNLPWPGRAADIALPSLAGASPNQETPVVGHARWVDAL
jgi:hypothetical protein